MSSRVRGWLLVLLVLATPVYAQSPADPTHYAMTAWATQKVLPGHVLSIAQDLEGYLWLGTANGLVRFDGTRFEFWTEQSGNSALPSGQVTALLSSSKGGLWIGFAGGHGAAHLHRGRLVRYAGGEGGPTGIRALVEDRQGTIWAASGHGLFRFTGDKWSKLAASDGYAADQALTVYEDRRGRIWISTPSGLYVREDNTVRLVDASVTEVESMAEDRAGNLWVTDRALMAKRLGPNDITHVVPAVPAPLVGWRIIPDERDGLLVASFSGGLFRIPNPTAAVPTIERIPFEHRLSGSPRALYRDRDDNVWVGMRGGLLRLSVNPFEFVSPLAGLNHDGVRTTTLGPDGSVWVATTHALNRFRQGTHSSYPVSGTRALHFDRSGTMWVVTDDRVHRLVNDRLVPVPIADIRGTRVYAIATAGDRAWLCTAFKGLLSWHDGVLTSHRPQDDDARQCHAILADRQGRIWAGFSSGGVELHDRGKARTLTERDGLAPGSVVQIIESADGSIWIATTEGLSRYQRGKFAPVTGANAPIDAVVPVLVEDDQGYIWMAVDSGAAMLRFHAREMDKVATDPAHRLVYALFDDSDGLQPGTKMWHSGVGATRDTAGRLWLVKGPGITIVDPRRLRDVRPLPPPRIDAVTVDGTRLNGAAAGRLRNGATVQFTLAAISLTGASKLQFRHRLDGHDADWVYDGNDREVRYSNLPGGAYRFLVSSTQDGVWTEPAVFTFAVAPPFYLNRWFLVSAGVLVVACIAIGTWLRERAVKSRYALVVAERTRMSREIHDTLLQSLASLGPELEALAVNLPPDDASEVRRLRRQVGRTVREARMSILELRRNSMETPKLADSLADLAESTASRHTVRPNVTVTGRRPDHADCEVDAELAQIAREAVSNAVRHGDPRHIDIAVAYNNGHVSLTVTDDGRGFDPASATTSRRDGEHFGLVTMRERAEKVGGEFRVDSVPGEGTTVHAVARVSKT